MNTRRGVYATGMHHSFLVYRHFRYLKWAAALTVTCIGIYWWHEPAVLPNGGSWVGYGLGTLGAVLILWLTWFGIRKRSYASTQGTVHGWLSAHVYFGLALVVVATLHTGFQFGWNVHTLAYALMLLVVCSGVVGVILYRWCPRLMSAALRGSSRRELLEEIAAGTASVLTLADEIGGEVHERVLLELDPSRATVKATTEAFNRYLVSLLAGADHAVDANALRALLAQIEYRALLLQRLQREARLKRLLDVWLLIHVPASIALLVALFIHIVAVFAYW